MSEKMTMRFECPAVGGHVQLVQPEGKGWWRGVLEAGPRLARTVVVDADEEYDLPALDADPVFSGRYKLVASQSGKFNRRVTAYRLTYAELEYFFRNLKRWFE